MYIWPHHNLATPCWLVQAKDSSGGGKSSDEIIDECAASIISRIPASFDTEGISMLYPLKYSESMNTVLLQECMRYNPLIDKITGSLPQLRKALKGLVVMTVELEGTSKCLLTQKVGAHTHTHAHAHVITSIV